MIIVTDILTKYFTLAGPLIVFRNYPTGLQDSVSLLPGCDPKLQGWELTILNLFCPHVVSGSEFQINHMKRCNIFTEIFADIKMFSHFPTAYPDSYLIIVIPKLFAKIWVHCYREISVRPLPVFLYFFPIFSSYFHI